MIDNETTMINFISATVPTINHEISVDNFFLMAIDNTFTEICAAIAAYGKANNQQLSVDEYSNAIVLVMTNLINDPTIHPFTSAFAIDILQIYFFPLANTILIENDTDTHQLYFVIKNDIPIY